MPNDTEMLVQKFREGCAADFLELAVLHDRELTAELLENLHEVNFPTNLSLLLQTEEGQQSCEIVQKALNELPKPLDKDTLDELAADYAAIYLNHALSVSPYESPWLDDDGLMRQEPMFKVKEVYKRFHLEASDWKNRSEDHLVLELQFLAHLLKLDQNKQTLVEMANFLDNHLLRWLDKFAKRVAARCYTPFYAGLVLLTSTYVDEVRDILAEILAQPRPSPEEIEDRLKPNRPIEEVPLQFMPGGPEGWQ